MAEPYDSYAADLIAALGVTGADAEAVAAVLQEATPTELEALSNLLTVRARIGPLLLTAGAPPDSLGAPGSFAIDIDAKVFYGPKDAVTGWPAGEPFLQGPQGDPGADGEEISLRVDSGFIQWRLGTGSWTNLVELVDLKGDQGDPGDEVGLRVSGGQIQWRLGEGAWSNLIAVADLKGDQGDPGAPGTDGADGSDGWSPVFAVVVDGARRVQQVVDWVGGEGTKPATGKYVGATGLVDAIGDGVDVRGPSGAGTGDVLGPGTHAADYLPQWNGANSNSLKAGRAIGAAADTDIPAKADVVALIDAAVAALIGGAPGALDTLNELAAALGDDEDFAASVTAALAGKLSKTVSASGRLLGRVSSGSGDVEELTVEQVQTLIGAGGGASSGDLIRVMLAVADLQGARFGTPNGIADAFDDQTGVDTAGSTGELFGSARYVNLGAPGANLIPDQTSNGAASASGQNSGSQAAWNAMDRADTTFWASPSGAAGPHWLQYDFGSSTVVGAYKIIAGVSAALSPKTFTLQGSDNGSTWTTIDAQTDAPAWSTKEARTYQLSSPAAYRYYRVEVTAVGSGVQVAIYELELLAAVQSAMDLRSIAVTAASAPSQASLVVIAKGASAITPGTHLKGYVSRNGGSNWTEATLVAREAMSDGFVVYEAFGLSISGQPSGTSMKWRVTTVDTFEIQVTAVYLGWS